MNVNFRNFFALFILTSLTLSIQSCRPAVEVVGEWSNPDAKPTGDIDKILVTAMVSDQRAKNAFEEEVESELEKYQVQAVTGAAVFPTMFTENVKMKREELMEKVAKTNSDAILTMSILDKETRSRYVPGNNPYQPVATYSYYNTYYGYYNYYYPTVYDPGYYTTTSVYYMEANLYDAESEKLLWSVQSKLYDPEQLASFSGQFSQKVIDELSTQGYLLKPEEK